MRSRTLRIVAVLALLVCFVCPVLETFDTWDHTMQTGSDTEYTLVVLALCVGVAYSFARFIFKSGVLGFAKRTLVAFHQRSFFSMLSGHAFLPLDGTSPPSLPLRI